jgi:hypothetical protein
MPRKPKSEESTPAVPKVASGDAVVLPVKAAKKQVSAGVARPRNKGTRMITASIAGSADGRFPKGGAAFAVWCKAQGIDPNERRDAQGWDKLLSAFADRPIHGHRRGAAGGSHKPGRR